jgi:hypothetical protein
MREQLCLLTALALGFWAPSALAAPICQNRLGDSVRCDAPSAMPVGWKVSPETFTARVLSRAPRPTAQEVEALVVILAALFAIIALLPRFDGSGGEDWDRQEGDEID